MPAKPSPHRTILEALAGHAANMPNKVAFRALDSEGAVSATISYSDLAARAAALGRWMQKRTSEGSRVVLSYPAGVDFIVSLVACFLTRRIAVPLAIPDARSIENFRRMVAHCGAEMVLTIKERQPRLESALPIDKRPCVSATDQAFSASAFAFDMVDPKVIAILQYSSGSTRLPRAIVIDHRNIMSNLNAIQHVFGHTSESDFVTWLPQFHDMGLIGTILQPINLGSTSTLFPPAAFGSRPRLWLEAISRFRPHTSGAPDSAYRLCVQSIAEDEIATLDLSSWKVAFNGAERVRAETLIHFATRFAVAGFAPSSFLPCYGLAEATLLVAGASRAHLPVVKSCQGEKSCYHWVAADAPASRIVPLGPAAPGVEIRIVDPETLVECAEGQLGEVWVRGPSVARGYWGETKETSSYAFNACLAGSVAPRYLRTGDLGFVEEGVVSVAGRIKDLIIHFGEKHNPEDLEETVESLSLPAGCLAAAVLVDRGDEETLTMVVEVNRGNAQETLARLAGQIVTSLTREHRVAPESVVFVRRGQLPRTTSGKVKRWALRNALAEDRLAILAVFAGGHALLPLSTTEEKAALAAILREILGTDAGSCETDIPFVQLGLDSLQAMRLYHSVAMRDLSCGELNHEFLQLSLDALAERIVEGQRRRPTNKISPPTATTVSSPSHRAHLLLQEAAAVDPSSLNLTFTIQADHSVSNERLIELVEETVRAHPSLRPLGDLRGHTAGANSSPTTSPGPNSLGRGSTRRRHEAGCPAPVHPEEEPPFRAILYKLFDGKATLLIVIHHTASDLWSIIILAEELAAACAGRLRRPALRRPVLPPEADGRSSLSYERWKCALLPLPPPLLTQRSTTAVSPIVNVLTFVFKEPLVIRLRQMAAEFETTLYILILAAFTLALSRLFGRKRLLVMTPVSIRPSGSEKTIDYLVTPVPVVLDLTNIDNWPALIAHTAERFADAVENRSRIISSVAGLGSARGMFDVAFQWQQCPPGPGQALARLALGGLQEQIALGPLTFARPKAIVPPLFHPLEVSIVPERHGLLGSMAHDTVRAVSALPAAP